MYKRQALAFGDEDRVVRVIRKTGVLTEWSLEDDAVTSVKRGWAKLRHLELDAFDWRTVAGGSYTSHAIGGIRLITVSHDGSRAASRVEGIARIIDLARGSVVTELDVTGDVQALALSPTGDELAVGGRHGDLRVLSVSSGREVARHTPHTDRVMALEYSPDGTRLATGADDGAVLLWDTTTYERVGALPGHTDYIHCLRFSPDGTQLVSAGGDGIIRIWDTIPARERRAAR